MRICSIGPHLPVGWGDAVKWNIVVFSVVLGARTCSIGPHLPALFWCGCVFGQCEEEGDHLSRRFLSEKTKMLNRIPSVGASCDIRYSPLGAGKSWTQSWRACFWSVRRGGRSFIPEISFRDDGNVESHSVRGGIMRYSIFSPGAGLLRQGKKV